MPGVMGTSAHDGDWCPHPARCLVHTHGLGRGAGTRPPAPIGTRRHSSFKVGNCSFGLFVTLPGFYKVRAVGESCKWIRHKIWLQVGISQSSKRRRFIAAVKQCVCVSVPRGNLGGDFESHQKENTTWSWLQKHPPWLGLAW